jgi:predicted DNA-binding WGR domain protein
MPDERSPIQHHLVLHRVDPDRRVARFYLLLIEYLLLMVRSGRSFSGRWTRCTH